MTDKATVEIPSPVAGVVVALGGDVGSTLAVGAELVRLEVPGEGDREVAASPREAASPAAKPTPTQPPAPTPLPTPAPQAATAPAHLAPSARSEERRVGQE